MSTVKITQLPENTLTSNTSNTIFIGVDLENDVTGIYTYEQLFADPNAYTDAAFLKANTPSVVSNSAFVHANAAYNTANSAEDFANASFITANSAYVSQNTTANFANAAFVTANASYNSQNTTSSFANGAFTKANSGFATANSGASFANGAFVMANSGYAAANSGATFANAAFTRANSAYAKANSALANTSGIFDGSLTVTGDLQLLNGSVSSAGNMTVNGTMVLANSNFTATESAITIKATANVATPSNDGYMLHISGKQNVPSRIVFDSYSETGNSYGLVAGRTARGNVDYPAPVQAGDVLMRLSGNGYGTSEFAPLGIARIDIVATETYTNSARGSQIKFYNIENGSNTLVNIATFNANNVTFAGAVSPLKGFVWTPRVEPDNSSLVIDFANDSLIKANLSGSFSISFANYTAGKVVEVWLVNTSGSTQTITHGCSSTNSTVNSTTFTIPSTSSAHLKYFSISGDLANTFVSVNA
jgi:hypothetical protein